MMRPAGHGHGGGAPAAWQQALELEKRLRSELRKRSFWDPEVRRLRLSLQQAYEALVFTNFEFAQANDVEQALWKSVYYKPIEEFRARIRTAQQAQGQEPGLAPATSEEAKLQQQKLTSAYLKFLDEAVSFYKRLVWKLQWVYGSVGAAAEIEPSVQNDIQETTPQYRPGANGAIGMAPDCRAACHRCLIYLGDLCRYQSQVLKMAREQWSRAVAFYRQAAEVLPGSGNPYNQLAVMSYFAHEELRAVYYYFRSLAVAAPFATAKENLLLLFERNRTKYGQIAARHAQAAAAAAAALIAAGGPGAGGGPATAAASGLFADVGTRFVRLHGMLFDRINLEQYREVSSAAFKDLEALLGNATCLDMLQKQSPHDNTLLHLAVLAIFTAEHCSNGSAGGRAGAPRPGGAYLEATTRSSIRGHALAVVYELLAKLCSAAAGSRSSQPAYTAMLSAIHTCLSWLLLHLQALLQQAGGAAAAAAAASSADMSPEEAAARTSFLRAAIKLVQAVALEAVQRHVHPHGTLGLGLGLLHLLREQHQQLGGGLDDGAALAVQTIQEQVLTRLPEDAELAGFEPLRAVLDGVKAWPPPQPDGMASRLGRLLAQFRSLADTVGALTPAAASGAAPGQAPLKALQNLSLAAAGFRTAVEDVFAGRYGNEADHLPAPPPVPPMPTTLLSKPPSLGPASPATSAAAAAAIAGSAWPAPEILPPLQQVAGAVDGSWVLAAPRSRPGSDNFHPGSGPVPGPAPAPAAGAAGGIDALGAEEDEVIVFVPKRPPTPGSEAGGIPGGSRDPWHRTDSSGALMEAASQQDLGLLHVARSSRATSHDGSILARTPSAISVGGDATGGGAGQDSPSLPTSPQPGLLVHPSFPAPPAADALQHHALPPPAALGLLGHGYGHASHLHQPQHQHQHGLMHHAGGLLANLHVPPPPAPTSLLSNPAFADRSSSGSAPPSAGGATTVSGATANGSSSSGGASAHAPWAPRGAPMGAPPLHRGSSSGAVQQQQPGAVPPRPATLQLPGMGTGTAPGAAPYRGARSASMPTTPQGTAASASATAPGVPQQAKAGGGLAMFVPPGMPGSRSAARPGLPGALGSASTPLGGSAHGSAAPSSNVGGAPPAPAGLPTHAQPQPGNSGGLGLGLGLGGHFGLGLGPGPAASAPASAPMGIPGLGGGGMAINMGMGMGFPPGLMGLGHSAAPSGVASAGRPSSAATAQMHMPSSAGLPAGVSSAACYYAESLANKDLEATALAMADNVLSMSPKKEEQVGGGGVVGMNLGSGLGLGLAPPTVRQQQQLGGTQLQMQGGFQQLQGLQQPMAPGSARSSCSGATMQPHSSPQVFLGGSGQALLAGLVGGAAGSGSAGLGGAGMHTQQQVSVAQQQQQQQDNAPGFTFLELLQHQHKQMGAPANGEAASASGAAQGLGMQQGLWGAAPPAPGLLLKKPQVQTSNPFVA